MRYVSTTIWLVIPYGLSMWWYREGNKEQGWRRVGVLSKHCSHTCVISGFLNEQSLLQSYCFQHVDDLILVCNNKDKLLQIKDELFRKFEMKDLGDLHFFLGMEVETDRAQRLLYINQIRYLKEILKRFRMEDCKAIGVSLDPKTKLKKNVNKDDEMVKVPYQQAMRSLMYAMLCTWSDLAYPISMVS